MSDPKEEKVIFTLHIELPKDYVGQLSEAYWTRLELAISNIIRMNLPQDSNFWPSVWKEA